MYVEIDITNTERFIAIINKEFKGGNWAELGGYPFDGEEAFFVKWNPLPMRNFDVVLVDDVDPDDAGSGRMEMLVTTFAYETLQEIYAKFTPHTKGYVLGTVDCYRDIYPLAARIIDASHHYSDFSLYSARSDDCYIHIMSCDGYEEFLFKHHGILTGELKKKKEIEEWTKGNIACEGFTSRE